jgi:hypothetical protein
VVYTDGMMGLRASIFIFPGLLALLFATLGMIRTMQIILTSPSLHAVKLSESQEGSLRALEAPGNPGTHLTSKFLHVHSSGFSACSKPHQNV